MQRLGRVSNLTPSQNIVVKLDKPPKIGTYVVDDNLKTIGKVFDIIGPVSSPYAVIKPSVVEPDKFVGQQLYMLLSKKERSK